MLLKRVLIILYKNINFVYFVLLARNVFICDCELLGAVAHLNEI